MTPAPSSRRPRAGYSLIELLAAMVVFSIILVLCLNVFSQSNRLILGSTESAATYREGTRALEMISSHLRLATLMPQTFSLTAPQTPFVYPDLASPAAGSPTLPPAPGNIGRWSDLMFISGPASAFLPASVDAVSHAFFFQATLNGAHHSPAGINEVGYFVALHDGNPPPFLASTPGMASRFRRLRLMQFRRKPGHLAPDTDRNPTVRQVIRQATAGSGSETDWFILPITSHTDIHPIANNVLAMIVVPQARYTGAMPPPPLIALSPATSQLATVPDYLYNTRPSMGNPVPHQLPEYVSLTLVVAEEESVVRYLARTPGGDFDFGQSIFETLTDESQIQDQLNQFLVRLDAENLRYRVFQSTIRLESASPQP